MFATGGKTTGNLGIIYWGTLQRFNCPITIFIIVSSFAVGRLETVHFDVATQCFELNGQNTTIVNLFTISIVFFE